MPSLFKPLKPQSIAAASATDHANAANAANAAAVFGKEAAQRRIAPRTATPPAAQPPAPAPAPLSDAHALPPPRVPGVAAGVAVPEGQREQVSARMWQIIDRLPQRDCIEASDARQWIGEVMHQCGADKAVWHAARLGGFGGSEIGALVRNHHGLYADFGVSAHDLVLSKLMRRLPEQSRAQMDRGVENEHAHAQRFRAEMGGLRDEAAFERLSQARGKLAWMRYSPDDVVLMRSSQHAWTRDAAGQRPVSRWLIDYKSPSEVEPSAEVGFQYACQLAQGAILCEESGIELHGLMLSQFDWKNWALKNDAVQASRELREMVREAGNWGWSHVLGKTVPDYVRAPRVEGQAQFLEQAGDIAARFAQVQALQKAADDRAQELRRAMLSHLDPQVRFDNARLSVPGGTLSAARSVNTERVRELLTPEQLAGVQKSDGYDARLMASQLRTLGIDLKPFAKMTIDATKLAALAQVASLDYDAMVTEQIRFSANPEIVQAARSFIDEHFPLRVEAEVEAEVETEAEAEAGTVIPKESQSG